MKKQPLQTASANAAATQAITSPLKGYVPFPAELRTKDHVEPSFDVGRRPTRAAVLVLHGIGAQKPYETLDQFARGLLGFFRPPQPAKHLPIQAHELSDQPTQEIRLRQHKANLNTSENDWTQAFVRVRTPGRPGDLIDVYEYYWAPVITDRVSALQSLMFLIAAGLSPFQYLRDNLTVINQAHASASRGNKLSWLFFALCREIYRMLFVFIPLIALALALYWLLASSVADHLVPGKPGLFSYLLRKPPLDIPQAVHLASAAVRFVLLGMCSIFLFQEFFAGAQGNPSEKSPPMYTGFIGTLFAALLVVPHLLQGHLHLVAVTKDLLHLPFWTQAAYGTGFLLFLVGASFCSKVFRSAWKRAGKALSRHRALTIVAVLAVAILVTLFSVTGVKPSLAQAIDLLTLPRFLNWPHLILYAFLAIFAYIGQKILTSAIGCLAVYLGADDLSKNFAARSQILHECTTMLINLLAGRDETGTPNKEWIYDQVLVAGHSLGSVIAYDSLSQLIVRVLAKDPSLSGVPLEKVKGLLTFGCPLNKVVYFFRARTNLRTKVLSQILYTLHSFRLRTPLPPQVNPAIAVPHPFPEKIPFAPDFLWYNAYSPFDIISGRMQFYSADLDVPVERGVTPWTAHLSYWENDDLYSLFSDLMYPRPLTNQ
ncbi:MAG: hypothetical protein WCB11_24340 [Terriglobales bacterium]|jgi:hypothetical protein